MDSHYVMVLSVSKFFHVMRELKMHHTASPYDIVLVIWLYNPIKTIKPKVILIKESSATVKRASLMLMIYAKMGNFPLIGVFCFLSFNHDLSGLIFTELEFK